MFINNATEGSWAEAATLGYAAQLLLDTNRQNLSLVAFKAWLRVPVKLDQILMLFSERGTPYGYLTWAYVTPETAGRLGDGSGRPPLPEDWNDGTLLWIVDVVAPYGDLKTLLEEFRRKVGTDRTIGYAGRRDGRQRLRGQHR